MMVWQELLSDSILRLESCGVPNFSNAARYVIEQYQEGEYVTQQRLSKIETKLKRLCDGEPLQYVLGEWSFRNIDVLVDKRVLIPRPETEEVAGWTVELAKNKISPLIVDLGTGSGVIGLSLAVEVSDAQVILTDNSPVALQVARANTAGIGSAGTRVNIAQGSWYEALDQSFKRQIDIIVSNPPYCSPEDDFSENVAWEPQAALFASDSGLSDLKKIVNESIHWLKPGGSLVLELAPWQSDTIKELTAGFFEEVTVKKDLSGRDRCIIATRLQFDEA